MSSRLYNNSSSGGGGGRGRGRGRGGGGTPNVGVEMSEEETRQRKRHTKQKAFDVRPLIVTMMEDMLTRRCSPWDRRPVQPHSAYARCVLPPMANRGDPSDCFCTKIARNAANKSPMDHWTPEGRRFIAAATSGEMSLWDGLTYGFDTIIQAHKHPILAMEWSHSNDWLLSADQQGFVQYWSSNMTPVEAPRAAHREAVQGISFSPTDDKFCTCSADKKVKVWDFWDVRQDIEFTGHGWDVKSVDWHPTSSLIASASKDCQIKFIDPRANRELYTISSHKRPMAKVQWNANGYWLLSASQDHTMKLFDVRKMQEFQTVQAPNMKSPTSIGWHPFHERLFASGHYDGGLAYWVVGMDAPCATVPEAHDGNITSMRWHPAGMTLATGSVDKFCKFWVRQRPGETKEQYGYQGTGRNRRSNPNMAGVSTGNSRSSGFSRAMPPDISRTPKRRRDM